MAKQDFEDILDSVKAIMVAKLTAKLTQIDTAKNDGITLVPVSEKAYFLQSLDEEVANFDPFIAYGIADIESTSVGPKVAEKIFISIVIVLADNGVNDINRKMFRYSRALKEIFQENWQIHDSSSKINVTRSTVVPFESLDSSAQYKAIGIELEVNLA